MRIKLLRQIVQIAVLASFVWLLVHTRWDPRTAQPAPPFFLRMDPLSMLTTALSPASRFLPYFLPALVLLVLTAVFGRFFCGWICPLGTTLDVWERLTARARAKAQRTVNAPGLKYYVLAAVLVAAVFGTQIAWLFDPIPLLTRTAATVFYPLGQEAYNIAVTSAGGALRAAGLRLYPVEAHHFVLNVPVAIVFAALLGLSLLTRRYWCRTFCPLGALLGLVGRWGLWRRYTTGCVTCKRCVGECKMGAIPDDKPAATRSAECILCYDCLVCPKPGIASIGLSARREGHLATTDTVRRSFVLSALGGLAYGAVASTGASRRPLSDRLIRPPGAIKRTAPRRIERLTEAEFRAACVRCGNCMKVCPTGGLQPAVFEAGWDGFYTPVLVPVLGWCEENCNACGQVCPSGALIPFDVREKRHIKLGRAHIDQSKCLAWRRGDLYKECLVCKECCPYGAVWLLEIDGRMRPAVNEQRCVGCGQCENKCPVTPERAIRVQRKGPQR